MENPFRSRMNDDSHTVFFETERLDFSTQAGNEGYLVLCTAGELSLVGHDGEWIIPPNYMVYIPSGRMFRIFAQIPSSGRVVKFGHDEVKWKHNGCWVGPQSDLAVQLIDYSQKWCDGESRKSRLAKCFFLTLGEMVPGWFKHDRILWTPYTENPSIQKVIDYAMQEGPSVTLPNVALHVGMSERTLRRHMKKELGQSWREFIREMRMNRAMELLRQQRKSVTETAFEVGFSSSSAFSSAFLQYVGKTPSAFARSTRTCPTKIAR